MNWDSFLGSAIVSAIATVTLCGILWMFATRKCIPPHTSSLVLRSQALSVGLKNVARRANRALRFRTAKKGDPDTQTVIYEVWNDKLPITRKVLDQIRCLANSNEPFYGVLVSTYPPTIKMTQAGPLPIVTRLIAVKDIDPSNLNGIARENLVATFHTHRSRLDVLEHDENAFNMIDAFAGPKIHIIGSVKGLQFYRARHGPVVTERDWR